MDKPIKFYKMHGLGNDFIITHNDNLLDIKDITSFIKSISHRRTGVGCDQFINYCHLSNSKYGMRIYNADGTIAEACGNGTRCLIKLINNIDSNNDLEIISFKRSFFGKMSEGLVSVNMGYPSFQEDWMVSDEQMIYLASLFDINFKDMVQVDMGNPHLIVFNNTLNNHNQSLFIEKVATSQLYTQGVNISFADVKYDLIDLKVWERGVGYSLACGSAACACFAGATMRGLSSENVRINFKFGILEMSKDHEQIIMTGPASFVAEGYYQYEG